MSVFSFVKRQWRDIPKTILFNFKMFDIKTAIKLPVLISHNVYIEEIHKGCIEIPENAKRFSIKIGIEGVSGVSFQRKGYLLLSENSKLVFEGSASLSSGISIRCLNGIIYFGDNFYCNCNLGIICAKHVEFGESCILGWNIHIRDCDGHEIYKNKKRINEDKSVIVGNHVWIGQDVKILKGSRIPNNSIIAMNSCVTKVFEEENVIIGGYPAAIVKKDIEWRI